MSSDKLRKLAEKLAALAERGVGGEKVNAQAKLEALCLKHGISLEDLAADKIDMHTFKIRVRHAQLFTQVSAVVCGKGVEVYGNKRYNSIRHVKCTEAQRLEIEFLYGFYGNRFDEDYKIFVEAFIAKNSLYAADGNINLIGEMSPEDRERAYRMQQMAEGLPKHQIRKQLSHEK